MAESLITAYVLSKSGIPYNFAQLCSQVRLEEAQQLRSGINRALGEPFHRDPSATVSRAVNTRDDCTSWPWEQMDALSASTGAAEQKIYRLARELYGLVHAPEIDWRRAIECHYALLEAL